MKHIQVFLGHAWLALPLLLPACEAKVPIESPPLTSDIQEGHDGLGEHGPDAGPMVDTSLEMGDATTTGCGVPPMVPKFSFPMAQQGPTARAKATWQPWTSGHPLAVQGGVVLAVDADNGTVVRIDRAQMTVVATVAVGARPSQLVVAPDGTTFVSVRGAGAIVRLDAQGKLQSTWPVGTEPQGLALSPDAKTLYVALAGDRKLLALDATTGTLLGQARTGTHPTAVVAGPERVVVLDRTSAPRFFALPTLVPGGTNEGQATPLGGTGMVGICGNSDAAKAIRAVSGVLDPESQAVFVPHVRVASGSLATSIQQASSPECGLGSGTGSYGDGSSDCKLARRPVEVAVSRLSTPGAEEGLSAETIGAEDGSILAARFDQPTDVVAHPTKRMLLVAARGSDNVFALAVEPQGALRPILEITTGQAPSGIAVNAEGDFAYVLNSHDFTVGEVALQPLLDFQGGKLPKVQQGRTVTYGVDTLAPAARLGRRTFTFARNPALSSNGQFACATCHLDGAEDGQVWFVAGGPRQTPALAGRLAGTAPFNWKGTHDALTDNMAETIHRMGGLGLGSEELKSLEQFLLVGMQAPQNPNVQAGGLNAHQAAGKALFENATVGCNGCHVAGKTDGQSHDVGTMSKDEDLLQAKVFGKAVSGIAYDTPSLQGLYATAPYLHDGSAATLEDVLKLADSGKMGHTAALSVQQKADLVAYLLSL
jgi:hypothetical protein